MCRYNCDGIRRKALDIMSDKELTAQFNRVEKSKADTWAFVAFAAMVSLVAWINS